VELKPGTTVAINIYNAASLATSDFGFTGENGKITADVNPEDVRSGAYVKVPIKFMAPASGNMFQIVI